MQNLPRSRKTEALDQEKADEPGNQIFGQECSDLAEKEMIGFASERRAGALPALRAKN